VTRLQKLRLRKAEISRRLAELAGGDEPMTDEERAEVSTLSTEIADVETRMAAAEIADQNDETRAQKPEEAAEADPLDELRVSAHVGRYLVAALRGRSVAGAERELLDELRMDDGVIPLTLWDRPEARAEDRAVTGAPTTVGVNLDPLQPAVFAPSILPALGVEMPMVGTGTYATGTITTSVTAGAVAKGGDAPATAAAFTVSTATPKRISARLELAVEDIAAVGQANFEAVLRDNLSLVLSDQLDLQGLNGDGTAPNLQGLIGRLTDPTDPTDVAGWGDFARLPSDHVDGLWATMESQVMLLVNPETYRLAARTFRMPEEHGNAENTYSDTPGEQSAAAYVSARSSSFSTNSRMPATASTIALGLAYRMGRGMRTAVAPVWDYLSIDDMYSGSGKGERYFTIAALVGDVILVQPAAYARFDLKVS